MKSVALVAALLLVVLSGGGPAYGAEGAGDDKYVSREELEKLKRELEEMKAQLRPVLSHKGVQPARFDEAAKDGEKDTLEKAVETLKGRVEELETKGE